MDAALPKTTSEQRAPLYEDVETLITTGFLSHSLMVGRSRLAIRSLGPGDVFLLKTRVGNGSDGDWKIWALASSVWVLDGYVLLGQANIAVRIATALRQMPKSAVNKMFSVLTALFVRQNKASQAVESYCHETTSRFIWRTHGHHHPASQSGVPGVEALGTNHIQRMWTFFNEVEDQRLRDETMWEGFKLTVSPHAPKGIKKIDERDKQIHQEMLERRQSIQDKFYYTAKGVLLPDGSVPGKSDGLKIGHKSADDLAAEMYRWVSGQDDWHDQVVNEYKQRVTAKYEAEKVEREVRLKALRAEQDIMDAQSTTLPMIGYTPEQLQEILKGRGVGVPGVKVISDGPGGSRDYLYNRYLETAPDAGVLRPVDGRLVPAVGGDLTETLAARMVAFRTEESES